MRFARTRQERKKIQQFIRDSKLNTTPLNEALKLNGGLKYYKCEIDQERREMQEQIAHASNVSQQDSEYLIKAYAQYAKEQQALKANAKDKTLLNY